jgi:hypothetical protein
MNQSIHSVQLTDAQTATLSKMPLYRILEQLGNGAIVISFEFAQSMWTVIDATGNKFSFDQYLSTFKEQN